MEPSFIVLYKTEKSSPMFEVFDSYQKAYNFCLKHHCDDDGVSREMVIISGTPVTIFRG